MLRFLIEKEFKQLIRNPALMRMALIQPMLVMLIMPLVANFDVKDMKLALVDSDRSPYSTRLGNKVTASGYFALTQVASSYRIALEDLEADRADVILEIPPNFERDLVREGDGDALIAVNAVNGARGGLGSAYLAGIIGDFARELRAERPTAANQSGASRFEIVPRYRYNPHLDYRIFMVPALMAMVITMICGFLPALNIVGEKERGTIEQLNVTPVSRAAFIVAKLIPHWAIGYFALTAAFAIAWLAYGLTPVGGYLTLYVITGVYIIAVSGMGLLISNFASSFQQAMFIMFFVLITMIFMSGMYTPVASMPDWAQKLSDVFPLKYFILALRAVYLKGSSLRELSSVIFALLIFGAGANALAVLTYRKQS